MSQFKFRIRIPSQTERIYNFINKSEVVGFLQSPVFRKMHACQEILLEKFTRPNQHVDNSWTLLARMWID